MIMINIATFDIRKLDKELERYKSKNIKIDKMIMNERTLREMRSAVSSYRCDCRKYKRYIYLNLQSSQPSYLDVDILTDYRLKFGEIDFYQKRI